MAYRKFHLFIESLNLIRSILLKDSMVTHRKGRTEAHGSQARSADYHPAERAARPAQELSAGYSSQERIN